MFQIDYNNELLICLTPPKLYKLSARKKGVYKQSYAKKNRIKNIFISLVLLNGLRTVIEKNIW